jgi:subtilisin family serine protease
VQPRIAMLAGLLPRSSIGADQYMAEYPTADGRGVIIGILDSGIDVGLPGFQVTTTGDRKVLDARDFSGEGRIHLEAVEPTAGTVRIGNQELAGLDVIAGSATRPYYGGIFIEHRLGEADIDGNGSIADTFALLVAKTPQGWGIFADTNRDGRLDDETPVHDFLVAGEYFGFGRRRMALVANFTEENGAPRLNLFFDNSSHGSHVAGIAAGHNMFEIEGFDGIAPGAQLVAAKISNNLRGGITVTGSMLRAMNYLADFAQQRGRPLILNMSFGVGNEQEGAAAIDSIVNEFALKHPDVFFVISAGNEGPGISTIGFPGSAEFIVSACALFPGVFTGPRPEGFATDADAIAEFSSRGGEVSKPDLCAPGVAFSNVPPWNTGDEISPGTSMAAPQLSGAAALLQSAMVAANRPARAVDLRQALVASAQDARGGMILDMGAGIPKVGAALDWLRAGHQGGLYSIRALADGGNTSQLDAAYRRDGLASPADTIQRFEVTSVGGQPASRFLLRSDADWIHTPGSVELAGGPALVTLRYVPSRLRTPGLYTGSVWAIPATDTLAGPAFRLTNTVVVPQPLEQPFVEGRDLGPGRLRRYFFDVSESSGGFTVEMELRYATQRGSLYLFEPDGKAFRGDRSVEAGGGSPSKVRLTVRADDLVPGVYEAVIVAPATSALSYELRVAQPRYVVRDVGNGPSALIGLRENAPSFLQDASVFQRTGEFAIVADSVEITARAIGAARTFDVRGQRDTPQRITIDVPSWAGEMVFDLQLEPGLWSRLTDFGVTVFDSAGFKVAEGPMSYGFGRLTVELPRYRRGQRLEIELFPAFAHLEPPPRWSAEGQLSFIAADPPVLPLAGVDTTTALTTAPGQYEMIRFEPIPERLLIPPGYDPLIEIVTNPAAGAPAIRRRAIERQ